MNLKRFSVIGGVVFSASLLLGGLTSYLVTRDTTPTGGAALSASTTMPCQEDEPCWDWRTMGNRTRGVCIDGTNQLESADGTLRPGGRGCQARPMEVRCEEALQTIGAAGLRPPVGWVFECPTPNLRWNGFPAFGVTQFDQRFIQISASLAEKEEAFIQGIIAHELCHAVLNTADEARADRCAAQYGFPVSLGTARGSVTS